MIAGPSSSGKTTFSHRLSIQLKTHGLTPHPIAVDDYFVDRKKTPLDEDGNYNFECLEAIDVEKFNQDMCELLAGKRVEMPRFNFKTGLREYKGDFLKLGKDCLLYTSSLQVHIPAGIESGKSIRLKGKGALGTGGGEAGDLLLKVTVGEKPGFERKGMDIYTCLLYTSRCV